MNVKRRNLGSHYGNSWALVVGVNEYESPDIGNLAYAKKDAEAISGLLVQEFGFPKENIISLYDNEADYRSIKRSFSSFHAKTNSNDRIVVFFAGHGVRIEGFSGDSIGYFLPCDAEKGQIETYLPWEDLTRTAKIIPAKHIFFILDTCYGGTAFTRTVGAGSKRFAIDMLERRSIQVLASGKNDQPVQDGNGPIPGHSIFTGHLILALRGEATQGGLITAHGVMSHVFKNVGFGEESTQTPHFGYLLGDGDFIFNDSALSANNIYEIE